MELMTKEIEEKARAQFKLGSDFKQDVVAKFFDPTSQWTWYLMNQDPDDPDYCWGIAKGFEVEMGSFSLRELMAVERPFGLKIERDLYFTPRPASEVWEKLQNGEHV